MTLGFAFKDYTTAIIAGVVALFEAPYRVGDRVKLPIKVVVYEELWGTHFKLKSYPMDARDEFTYKTDLTCRSKKALNEIGIKYPYFNLKQK